MWNFLSEYVVCGESDGIQKTVTLKRHYGHDALKTPVPAKRDHLGAMKFKLNTSIKTHI